MADAGRPSLDDLPILLVEDEPVNQRVIVRILKRLGYHVELANDGRRALEMLESASYSLVIMDCEMPVLDGFETAREIRKREAGRRRIPIIAVTAHLLDEQRATILAAGMDDCISKMDIDTCLPERLAHWRQQSRPPSSRRGRWSKRPASSQPALDPKIRRSQATVRVFLRHVDGQLAAIAAASEACDTAELKRACHKLKGSCLAVGLPKMARLCAEIEATPERASALLLDLGRELARVRARLTAVDSRPPR